MYLGISLSSGGARGFYQLGALHAAECNGLLSKTKYYAGTSIGSIIAMLLAIGWNALELFTTLCTDNYLDTMDLSWNVNRAVERFGLLSMEQLRSYLKKLVIHKYGGIPTLKQLYDQKNRVFLCAAYRLKHVEPCVYFNYKTHPDINVVEACILSSNIPFLFESLQYNGDYYIDGGLFDHNPLKYLQRFITEDENEHLSQTHKILCVSLNARTSTTQEEDDDDEKKQTAISSMVEYVKEVMLVSLFCQPKIKSSEYVDAINITSTDPTLVKLNVDNKTRIQWFCAGLEQGLVHFKEKK